MKFLSVPVNFRTRQHHSQVRKCLLGLTTLSSSCWVLTHVYSPQECSAYSVHCHRWQGDQRLLLASQRWSGREETVLVSSWCRMVFVFVFFPLRRKSLLGSNRGGGWRGILVFSGCHNKIPKTGCLNNRCWFSHSSGAWKSATDMSISRQVCTPLRSLSFACRWTPSHYVPTWSSSAYTPWCLSVCPTFLFL